MVGKNDIDVQITEVGPRDGLQNAHGVMATAAKKAWITAEAAAGVPEIEVCSFVPPKLIKGMEDAAEIVGHANAIKGLGVVALVPNRRGAADALAAGAGKISIPVSVSESHSRSNVRKSRDEMIEEVAAIRALCDASPDKITIEVGLSTAFGCSMEGRVAESEVVRMAVASVAAGADDVSLADTVGYADPALVKRVYLATAAEIGDHLAGIHLHNTMGLGLANAMAALEAGARAFDSSLGGLGGCPFAPGASGNIVTEDLVFMLESQGMRTGIDIEALVAVREIVAAGLPDDAIYGHVGTSGLPTGWAPSA